MAVSFYKMFGFPTGVGALVVNLEPFLAHLERPWFAGATVDVVEAPGTIVTMRTSRAFGGKSQRRGHCDSWTVLTCLFFPQDC